MAAKRRILLCKLSPRVPQAFVYSQLNSSDSDITVTLTSHGTVATKNTIHATNWGAVRSTVGMATGVWYWETVGSWTGSGNVVCGIATSVEALSLRPGFFIGSADSIGGPDKTGACYYQSFLQATTAAPASGTGVVRHWLDMDKCIYQVAINGGAWVTIINGPTGFRFKSGTPWYAVVALFRPTSSTASATINSGDPLFSLPMAYAAPPGANVGIYSTPAPVVTPVYLASEQFNTKATDTPANTEWMSRISRESDLTTERDAGCWVWNSESGVDRGGFTVNNEDGFLDAWIGWEWRDAKCEIFSGYAGDAMAAFVPYSTDVVDTMEINENKTYDIKLASVLAQFQKNMQTTLYPDTQANPQLAGDALPIVYGRPLYCSGLLLDISTIARNYQLHDAYVDTSGTGLGTYLSSIDAIYDRGNLFKGPSDPYVASNLITTANGGAFTTWAGTTPALPSSWTNFTTFGTANDRFFDGGGGTLRCQSGGGTPTVLYYSATNHLANRRYTITFTVTTVTRAGNIRFRFINNALPGRVSDKVVNITATGTVSLTIDTDPVSTSALFIMLGMPGDGQVDVTLDNLTSSTVQILDWTYYLDNTHRYGFHLANSAVGKIVANPVGPVIGIGSPVAEYPIQLLQASLARYWNAYGESSTFTLDLTALTALSNTFHYRLAAYLDKPTTFADFWKSIMDCMCGWYVQNRSGLVTFGNIVEPLGTPVLLLNETNCKSVRVYNDTAPGLSLRLAGAKNNTVHDTNDLFSTINDPISPLYNPTLAAALTSEYTVVKQGAPSLTPGANAPVSGLYAQALNAEAKKTLMQDAADLQSESNRVATIWRSQRVFVDVECLLNATVADSLEPGQVVRLNWPYIQRFVGGGLFMVKRVRTSFFSRKVSLTLWGRLP